MDEERDEELCAISKSYKRHLEELGELSTDDYLEGTSFCEEDDAAWECHLEYEELVAMDIDRHAAQWHTALSTSTKECLVDIISYLDCDMIDVTPDYVATINQKIADAVTSPVPKAYARNLIVEGLLRLQISDPLDLYDIGSKLRHINNKYKLDIDVAACDYLLRYLRGSPKRVNRINTLLSIIEDDAQEGWVDSYLRHAKHIVNFLDCFTLFALERAMEHKKLLVHQVFEPCWIEVRKALKNKDREHATDEYARLCEMNEKMNLEKPDRLDRRMRRLCGRHQYAWQADT